MSLTLVERTPLTVIGLQISTLPMSPDIPALWPRFVARMDELTDAAEPGVSYGIMQGGAQQLDYMAALSVTAAQVLPPGMTRRVLPGGTYARFSYPLSGLAAGFAEIYERLLPASGWVQRPGPCFERYDENFCPDRPESAVEIWLPVAPRA